MHFCRICRTEKNLKYTAKQLRSLKKQNKGGLPLCTTPTLGNICNDCEERLQNYHTLEDEDDDSEVDVDVDCGSSTVRREQAPVIVDDDEQLYNLYFKKVEEQRQMKKQIYETEQRRALTSHSLGSDGDTEIIEVLTSRESTPALELESMSDKPHKIVAVIDLEADEVVLPRNKLESDDEEIIFRRVEPIVVASAAVINPKKPLPESKKCRKSYPEREMRLIASLSLVSSDDSETEEMPPKLEKASKPASPVITPTKQPHHTNMKCKHCNVRLPDAESLQLHERIHTGIACPVCNFGFPTSKRLVHHIRYKHRAYQGDMLTERPRCAQDSAMTIRLRYCHRYTYYECQLCGRIDDVFKEHKEHVMQEHAAESKSLKDPMMKELKCPVCKEKCGHQYVLLCRHLLNTHTAAEYQTHLKEVPQLRSYGWNAARQKEVESTARIFKFTERKHCFFECKMCRKVIAGYFNYMQHLGAHRQNRTAKKGEPKKLVDKKSDTTSQQIGKNAKKSKPMTKSEEKIKPKVPPNTKPSKISKKINVPLKNPKKSKRKLSKKEIQAAIVRVKVKAPLRQFPAQHYKCKYCECVFEGFYRWNSHQLLVHSSEEFQRCRSCIRSFTNETKLTQHAELHNTSHLRPKRKYGRNRISSVDENCNTDHHCKRMRLDLSADIQPQLLHDNHPQPADEWLQDLLQLRKEPQTSLSGTITNTATTSDKLDDCPIPILEKIPKEDSTFQCCYCTHLFATSLKHRAHESEHASLNEVPMIKRYALATTMHSVR